MPSHSPVGVSPLASGRFDRETAFSIGDANDLAFRDKQSGEIAGLRLAPKRFLPRAFPRLRLQRFGPNPAVGRNRRRENRFGRKKRRVTRPCNSSTRAAHARKRAWTETGIVERRSRTLDAHLRGLHVRFPPPATRARRETTFRDRCRTTRHITSKNIGRDAWPPHAPRARRRPRRRNSRVFSSTVLSMPRSRRSRALAVSSSALIEGPFPPPHVSNFSIGRSGDSGCSVAHADTPLPSLVVPAA